MRFQQFPEEEFDVFENEKLDKEIVSIIQNYLKKTAKVTKHKEKEHFLMEMLKILIIKINEIANNGDFFEVGGYLTSAGYFLEEFNYREAQEIYLKAIEYYNKYMEKLQNEGNIKEASQIALRIANLYRNKLNNFELERKYIIKCIDYYSSLLEIQEGFSKPKEILLILYNITELFIKIEDWENSIKIVNTALELAHHNNFYDLIANLYFNLSDIYLFSGREEKSDEVIEKARIFFLSEEEKYNNKDNHYVTSQIFQIQKNLCSYLNNSAEFRKYSRKEAISYIKSAKKFLSESEDYHKVANYYRGAALCFKETELDNLEGASCFLLASNFFKKCNEYVDISYCFNDAAELFEEINFNQKAVKFYDLSAIFALKTKDYEFAIEKLIKAYNLIKTKNLKIEWESIAQRICLYLEKLSEFESQNEKFFISATLLLESLSYYKILGYQQDSKEIKNVLNKILDFYYKEYLRNLDIGSSKNSTVIYVLALSAIASIALQKYDKTNEILKILKNMHGMPKIAEKYKTIINEMLTAKKGIKFNLSRLKTDVKKVVSNSVEIKLLNNFIFY